MYQVMRVILFALLVTAGLVSCKRGCGSDCKPPDYIPNPKCPANNKIGICVFTKDNCLSDKECPQGCYCCPDGCGKKCIKLDCPAIYCPYPCKNGFKQDKDGCQTCECKESSTLPRNFGCPTPPSRSLVKCSGINDTCNSNSDCAGDKICCNNPCGRCCTDPVPIKDGFCPARRFAKCSSVRDRCHLDSECPDSKKCCVAACGNVCQAPIATPADNPGVCIYVPPFPPCSDFQNKRKCKADFECASYEKCCETTCGKFCLESEPLVVNPGKCPMPVSASLCIHYNKQCNQDGNCPPFQKCCEDNCGTSCQEPVPKPGRCPNFVSLLCAVHSIRCINDHQCPGNKLCCAGSCGNLCVDPDLSGIKPGVCPAPRDPAVVLCPIGSKDECKTDLDCPGDDKCCKDPCGKRCDLVRPKPGVCPVPTPLSVVLCSLTDSKDECTNDHECPFDLKCCDYPCGKRCDLVRPKPGSCPGTAISRTSDVCHHPGCDYDYECKLNWKCCLTGCGLICLPPTPGSTDSSAYSYSDSSASSHSDSSGYSHSDSSGYSHSDSSGSSHSDSSGSSHSDSSGSSHSDSSGSSHSDSSGSSHSGYSASSYSDEFWSHSFESEFSESAE